MTSHPQNSSSSSLSDISPSSSSMPTSPEALPSPSAPLPNKHESAFDEENLAKRRKSNNNEPSSSPSSPSQKKISTGVPPKRPRWWAESDMMTKALGLAYHGEHKLALTLMNADNVYGGIRAADCLFHSEPQKPPVPQHLKEEMANNRKIEKKEDRSGTDDDDDGDLDHFPSYCGFPFVFSEKKKITDEESSSSRHNNNNKKKNANDKNDDDSKHEEQQQPQPPRPRHEKFEVDEKKFFQAWHVGDNEAWSVPSSMLPRKAKKEKGGGNVASAYPHPIPALSPLNDQKKRDRFSQADVLRPWHRVAVNEELPFESEFLLNVTPVGTESWQHENLNHRQALADSIRDEDLLLSLPSLSPLSLKDELPLSSSSSACYQQIVRKKYGNDLWSSMMKLYHHDDHEQQHHQKQEGKKEHQQQKEEIPKVYSENRKVPIGPGSFQDITLLQRIHQLRALCGEIYQNEDAIREQEVKPSAVPDLVMPPSLTPTTSTSLANHEPTASSSDEKLLTKSGDTIISRSTILPPLHEVKPDTLPNQLDEQNIFSLARILRRCSKFHHEILQPSKIHDLAVHIVKFAGELFKSGIVPFSEPKHDSFTLPYNDERQCCVEQIRFTNFSVGDNNNNNNTNSNKINNSGIRIQLEDAPSDFLKLQLTNVKAVSEPFKIIVKPEGSRMCSQENGVCGLETKYTLVATRPTVTSAGSSRNPQATPKDINIGPSRPQQQRDRHRRHSRTVSNPANIARSAAAALAGEFVEYDVDLSDEDIAGTLEGMSPKRKNNNSSKKNSSSSGDSTNKQASSSGLVQTSAAGAATTTTDEETKNTHQAKTPDDEFAPLNPDDFDEITLRLKIKQLDASASFDLRHAYGTNDSTPVIKNVEVRLRHFAVVADVKDAPFKTLMIKLVCGAFRPLIRTALEAAIENAVQNLSPSDDELKRIQEERRRKLFGDDDEQKQEEGGRNEVDSKNNANDDDDDTEDEGSDHDDEDDREKSGNREIIIDSKTIQIQF